MQETEKIWMNGELVDWADARVHVGAHGLHYGTGVFEGIRCYDTERGPSVFRLVDHLKRMENSAKLIYMELPYTVDELVESEPVSEEFPLSALAAALEPLRSGGGPAALAARWLT